MARPSLASWNSPASALQKAQPVYDVCHSILNYLDPVRPVKPTEVMNESLAAEEPLRTDKDAPSKPQKLSEPTYTQ
jgi:hypothetical protein